MTPPVVVMGVAGCGKSSVGAVLARALGWPLIEGDDFHPPASKAKMRAGLALDDADRAGWLDVLADRVAGHRQGAVLTCSALKRSYRDRLRAAAPQLHFVYLEIDRATAQQRVASRAGHFFAPTLIESQFQTLEPPTGEPGVLRLDATRPPDVLCAQALAYLTSESASVRSSR